MKRGFPQKIEPTLPAYLGKDAVNALTELSATFSGGERCAYNVLGEVQQIKCQAVASVVRQDDGIDWVEGMLKPVLANPSYQRRVRTSAAVMGLALSMGASDIFSAFQSQQAVAAETIGAQDEAQRSAELALELKALAESAQQELNNSLNGAPAKLALADQNLSSPKAKFEFPEVDASTSFHVIQAGETLYGIARSYGISIERLASLNNLAQDAAVIAGKTLKVPSTAQPNLQVAQAATTGTNLALGSGGTTAAGSAPDSAIVQLRQRREALRQALVHSPDQTPAVAAEELDLSALTPYRVQAGDTIDSIAQRFGVERAALMAVNRFETPNVLQVDQNIAIPKAAAQPLQETEELSQALASVASAAAKSKADQLHSAQSGEVSLPPVTSSVGRPSSAKSPSRPIEPFKPVASAATSGKHRVQAGDTLAKIAREYGISVNALASANRITDPNIIFVGQQLNLPAGSTLPQPVSKPSPLPSPVAAAQPRTTGSQISYVDNLMDEIRELRRRYQTGSASSEVAQSASSAPAAVSVQTQPAQIAVSAPSSRSQQSPKPNRHVDKLKADLAETRTATATPSIQAEATADRPAQNIQVTLPIPPTVAQGEPQLFAAASLGSESYEPLAQSILSRSVSPDLPPLMSDPFMPGNSVSNGYIWPAEGVITSGYGWRWGRMHKGIDIAANVGTPIHAAADGVVTYSGWGDGYGNLVEITHADGSITLYAHNHRNTVKEGQRVRQGQHIADMGSTGRSTGPHLHFEIRPAGQGAVNPAAMLPPRR